MENILIYEGGGIRGLENLHSGCFVISVLFTKYYLHDRITEGNWEEHI
jgi:hypothetical protein